MRGLILHSSFNRDLQQSEAFTSEILDFYHLCEAKHHKFAAKNTQSEIKTTGDSRSFHFQGETETNLRRSL